MSYPQKSQSVSYERKQEQHVKGQSMKEKEMTIRAKFSKTWVKDEDSKTCFLCGKEFNFLYRRKHHCRVCGRVFCAECSEYFLSMLIDPHNPILDKESRLCKTCFGQCKEFINSDLNQYIEDEDSPSDDDEEEVDQLQVNRIEIKEQYYTKLKGLIKYVFQQEKKLSNVPQFGDQNAEQTFEFIVFCIKNLKMKQRQQGNRSKKTDKFHPMDINRNIMIKTCLHKDSNQFTYISGIINSKNIAKKNMCINFGPKRDKQNLSKINSNNTSFDSTNAPSPNQYNLARSANPGVKCLIIGISVDIFNNGDTNYPDLQQVITKQRAYVQRIVEGMKSFSPQIIFCKENMNQDILTSLENSNITVVQKIKPHIIFKISECAKCEIIDDIQILLQQNNRSQQGASNKNQNPSSILKKYVGNLHTAYFKTYSFATNQKTFMFLEQTERSQTCNVSLLITGPSQEILKQFKKSLQGKVIQMIEYLTNNKMELEEFYCLKLVEGFDHFIGTYSSFFLFQKIQI